MFSAAAAIVVASATAAAETHTGGKQWYISRLNDDNSWFMSCQRVGIALDPWLVQAPVEVPVKWLLNVPHVVTPGLPTPVEDPEVVANKTHAILTSLSFADHSNPDTLQRMADVPMFLPAGTKVPAGARAASILPRCETGVFNTFLEGFSVCHHPSDHVVGDIYMRGLLWIRSPCGTVIFAPHGTHLSDDLAERIRADGPGISVFSCSILEAVGLGLSDPLKPGPEAAAKLVRQLGPEATSYYTTHDMGDAFDSGLLWNLVVRYWKPQIEMRDLIGRNVYKAAQNNVSAWPDSDKLGESLALRGLGTQGIPYGPVAPGTGMLYLALFVAVVLLLIIGAASCCIKNETFQELALSAAASLILVHALVLGLLILLSLSEDINHNLLWFVEKGFPAAGPSGRVATFLSVFGTIPTYGAQALYAARIFGKKVNERAISEWYAAIMFMNIFAMSLVTWRFNLDGSPDPTLGDVTIHTAPWPQTAVTVWIHVAFPIHTVANVCRVVYDSFGEKWARKAMPLAYLTQGWLIVPLLAGWATYHTLTKILAVIDYAQHLTAFGFWMFYICKGGAPKRYAASAVGVVFHMVSLIPVFLVDSPQVSGRYFARDMATLFMIGAMLTSQCFWIKAALHTPPDAGKFARVPSELERAWQRAAAEHPAPPPSAQRPAGDSVGAASAEAEVMDDDAGLPPPPTFPGRPSTSRTLPGHVFIDLSAAKLPRRWRGGGASGDGGGSTNTSLCWADSLPEEDGDIFAGTLEK